MDQAYISVVFYCGDDFELVLAVYIIWLVCRQLV